MTNQHSTPSIDYRAYCPQSCKIEERYLSVGDGVALKLIDFQPAGFEDKPWLLFLPGWLSHISGWQEFLAAVTADYRVLYLESREKASSTLPNGAKVAFDIPRMQQDLSEAIDQLIPEGQPWVAAGSSLGSTVILEYLVSGKKQPNHSFLIAPNFEYGLPKWIRPLIIIWPVWLYGLCQYLVKLYLRTFHLDVKTEPEQYQKYAATIDAAEPNKLRKNALALMDYNGWHLPSKITQQVTVLAGRSDKLHGLDDLKRAIAKMSAAEFVEMESNKATHSAAAAELLRAKLEAATRAATWAATVE